MHLKGVDVQIASSAEASALVKSLRQRHGISRKELSERSGIPLRTVYAIENEELNNLSVDRLVALFSALGASIDVRVSTVDTAKDAETNRLVRLAATSTLDAEKWGIVT